MTKSFVHLHCHSEFSLLDGLSRIGDLLDAALEQQMPALALTDHGTMFGAIDFYSKAKEKGIKPIVGCEVYVSDLPLEQKPAPGSRNYHLVLLAENEAGYRNLIRLTTAGHLQGFYRKPRVDHALLERHSDGLICLSGCASSELARAVLDGDLGKAEETADWYRSVFGDRYYLELQYHDLDFQRDINQGVVHLSRKLGLPLVASNDVHYVRERHHYAHEVLLCIQTQTTMSDPKRMKMETHEFYMKNAEQMHALFGDYPEALTNTLAIAERCNLELDFGRPQLPRFQTPQGQTSEEYLRQLCEEGLRKRYAQETPEIRDRLEYELSVIFKTGFVDYFLLVYDVIHFARSEGIAVGPGRGSAAGALVAYVLFLTNIDPIGHGLSFERFLNPERVTMPDMDLDFADDRRDEVIRYVTERYGRDRVAQIITFGTMKPRAGVRDVGRVLGMSYADIDRVAKLVPSMCPTLAKAMEEAPELKQLYDSDSGMQKLLDTVQDLEGVARHASTHAAGVVISRDVLSEHVPLYKVPKNDQVTTQYAMSAVEKIGLLKMDFLGLRTLTILERARGFIQEATGQDLKLDEIPLDDPSIYELLSSGDVFGVFQVEGAGFQKLLRELRPTEFNHIIAAGALYRPGPMQHIPEFVARKNGLKAVEYDHPALKEVLEETYGIVVYQDQVMRLAVKVAGYTMGEADLLRRIMGKKKPDELAKHRSQFIARAEKLGTDAATAEHLFNIIEPFAGYAFNKAHSAAYALITCQTAYLKANYPREYMAGLLSAEREMAEKVTEAMAECRRLGINILPPDINRSRLDFTLEDGGIRFALAAIKHVGSGPIESILEARGKEPFASLEDFCKRIDWGVANKRVLESLIRCGAFDCFEIERGRMLASVDRIVAFGMSMFKAASAGQASLFGDIVEAEPMLQLAVADPATLEEKLEWEHEILGIYVSPHPVVEAEQTLRAMGAYPVSSVSSEHHDQRIRAGGMIQRARSFSTKDGRPMGSFQLSDLETALEVVVFSRTYEAVQSKIVQNALVVVEGKIDAADGRVRMIAEGIYSLEEAQSRRPLVPNGNGRTNGNGESRKHGGAQPEVLVAGPPRRLVVEMSRGPDRNEDLDRLVQLYEVLQRFRGQDEVEIIVRHGPRMQSLPLPNPRVGVCDQLQQELSRLLPANGWRVEATAAPH